MPFYDRQNARKNHLGDGMDDEKDAEIRYRAYELWEHAGRPPGQHFTYWLAAEREYHAQCAKCLNGSAPHLQNAEEDGYDSGIPDRFSATDDHAYAGRYKTMALTDRQALVLANIDRVTSDGARCDARYELDGFNVSHQVRALLGQGLVEVSGFAALKRTVVSAGSQGRCATAVADEMRALLLTELPAAKRKQRLIAPADKR